MPEPTASNDGQVTAYGTVYDSTGTPAVGVSVTIEPVAASRGAVGAIVQDGSRVATSITDGFVEFVNLVPGVRYKCYIDDPAKALHFTIPSTVDEFEIPTFIG